MEKFERLPKVFSMAGKAASYVTREFFSQKEILYRFLTSG